MKPLIAALSMIAVAGCGTLMNSGAASVSAPPGTSIDGQFGVSQLSKKRSHMVQFPDGRTCMIKSRVSPLYVIGNLVLTNGLGILLDVATGTWKTLDADACPGIVVD